MLRSSYAYLFTPRSDADRPAEQRVFPSPFPFEFMDAVVLVAYTVVLIWSIVHHRPWIDEAQAWLIARDDSMRDLLLRRLHYEGAPALWHLLLKLLVALHLPYAGLNFIAGAIALLGIFVFVRFSPFPRIFRWLLPFTFYLQYQYAVIARPYVLFPLLLFTLCILYCLGKPRPVLFALVAGLLANINAHAGILSCLFTLLYLHELYQRRELEAPQGRRRVALAAGVFVALCAGSVIAAFPAPDAMVVPTATGHVKQANPLLVRLLPPEPMPASAPPLDPSLEEAARIRAAQEWMRTQPQTSASQTTVAFTAPPPPPPLLDRALHRLALTSRIAADVATFPIAESNTLSVLFLLALALWLWSRHSLRFALPWLVSLPVVAYIWIYDHHTGMFALALVAAAWLSLQTPVRLRTHRPISIAFTAVALLVVVLQIGWTAHAVRRERHHPYDPGKETEAFLVENFPGKRIAGFGFQTVSLQPYAAHNLFFNQEHTYWLWSNANPIDLRRTEALEQHPDVVVVGDLLQDQDSLYNQWAEDSPAGFHPNFEMVRFWQEHGYHETHRFCGDRYMRAGTDNSVCELIFEPDQPSPSRP